MLRIHCLLGFGAIHLALACAGCGTSGESTKPGSEFADRVRLFDPLSGDAVEGDLHLPLNGGRYLELRIVPSATFGTLDSGDEIQPARQWPIAVVVYPAGSDRSDDDARYMSCQRYAGKNGLVAGNIPDLGSRIDWHDAGFSGQPQSVVESSGDEIVVWTFLSAPPGAEGSFAYDVLAFPTGRWINPAQYDTGAAVRLMRGLIQIGDPVG
jgi:hypothetical protein